MPTSVQQIVLELDFGPEHEKARRYVRAHPDVSLTTLLQAFPARAAQPLPPEWLAQPLKYFNIQPITFLPERGVAAAPTPNGEKGGALRRLFDDLYREDVAREGLAPLPDKLESYPDDISDNEAVRIAYRQELQDISRFLKNDLSVLIVCDKILTEHIYETVCKRAGRTAVLEDAPAEGQRGGTGANLDRAMHGPEDPAIRLAGLVRNLRDTEILVLRSIDLLNVPALIEVLYHGGRGARRPQLLGFLDPSEEVKKVLTDRFAVHHSITGLPRYIRPDDQGPEVHTVTRLLTAGERRCFRRLDPEGLYKNVAGLNAIQFRNAMRYVGANVSEGSESRKIHDVIRSFKRSSSSEIEIPDTTFESIGGYDRVKDDLKRTIALLTGRVEGLDDQTRQRLIPRGFIFHGPPGTGKTLFAKAIANELNATIQMVSGPEVMDKYVGQSESNLRHLFATARRNAPSVIFFDEFDSIASQRSTYSDGGSRANNAVVAQLLTELDGFQEDRAVLVIGTTNRLDIIDEALLRPSRLKPVEIGLPDFRARRGVAAIHADNFGVARLLRGLCRLVQDQLSTWSPDSPVPATLLEALFRAEPICRRFHADEVRRDALARDLREFATLLAQLRTASAPSTSDPRIERLQQRLIQVGQTHGMDLTTASQVTPGSVEAELRDLLEVLSGQTRAGVGLSEDSFVNAVLDMVAEYTEDFNNDEIRAVFQESSFDHLMQGQLITPRSLGVKIGLLRKRRDERTLTHLGRERGRR